ncbi:DNA-binding response OmpR family regulator [Pedobacter sp. UYP24]
MMKLLILEDEESLRRSILQYLTAEGNICDVAATFDQASEKISLYEYDCILLDLGLPDGEGLGLLRLLRKLKKQDGVLIISARDSIENRVEGLSLGADDYLVKPFHLSELNARITAIVRRRNFNGNDQVFFNEIEINVTSMEIKINNILIYLTKKEFDILLYFVTNKSKVISKSAVAVHIWGEDADMADSFDFMYTHIKNIRKKLTDGGSKDYFHSVYGVGYKFQ